MKQKSSRKLQRVDSLNECHFA